MIEVHFWCFFCVVLFSLLSDTLCLWIFLQTNHCTLTEFRRSLFFTGGRLTGHLPGSLYTSLPWWSWSALTYSLLSRQHNWCDVWQDSTLQCGLSLTWILTTRLLYTSYCNILIYFSHQFFFSQKYICIYRGWHGFPRAARSPRTRLPGGGS